MCARSGGLVFFRLAVLMRWLLIGLLISVGALLFAAGAMVRHVMRQRRSRVDETSNAELSLEAEDLQQRKAGELRRGDDAGLK